MKKFVILLLLSFSAKAYCDSDLVTYQQLLRGWEDAVSANQANLIKSTQFNVENHAKNVFLCKKTLNNVLFIINIQENNLNVSGNPIFKSNQDVIYKTFQAENNKIISSCWPIDTIPNEYK